MLFPSQAPSSPLPVNPGKLLSEEFCQIENTWLLGSIFLHWFVGEDLQVSCVLLINTGLCYLTEVRRAVCWREPSRVCSATCWEKAIPGRRRWIYSHLFYHLHLKSYQFTSWTLVNQLSKTYSGNLDRSPLFRAFAGIIQPTSIKPSDINITILERIWVIALMWDQVRACFHLYSSHTEQQSYHFVMKISTCSWEKSRHKFE